jgi:hypothetical protein
MLRRPSTRAHRLLAIHVAALAALFLTGAALPAAGAPPAYPVLKSSNRRYLVDQASVPYLMVGDAPQALVVNVTEAEAEMYFANRSAYGFNSLWVNLLCTTYTGGRPDASTLDGVLPFTGTIPGTSSYDLSTPNEAYFAHMDRLLDLAAEHGLQFLLDPIETGGFLTTMRDNGVTRCRNYGRFLGARYRDFDNIVWMSGNDYQDWHDPQNDAVVSAVALGIRDNDPRHIHTVELDYLVSSSLDDPTWVPIIDLNATYTYYPTYARLRDDYNRPNFLPTFMVEANYEFESLQGPVTTAPILRKQEYWTMTSGTTGQLYGNGYIWPFLSGWQDNLDTPGAVQMGILRSFFEPRAWQALVPDTSHVVVTAGYGTYSSTGFVADNNYLTAARTPDGTLIVVYTPILRTFTVNMSQLAAAAATRWFDPSLGTYVAISGSPFPNTGLRNFIPPGMNGDGDGGWVLVLETAPPETVPPVVVITSPTDGSFVAGTVPVTATATDNVGVAGVQFRIDGANLGGEDQVPPYETTWNTLTVGNGPHVVKAIARDLAGNRGADSVAVTVNNLIPPPPADHLALAYAFNEVGGQSLGDNSGNGNVGTLHGATFGPGRNAGGLAFDGVNDYAETPNSSSLDIGGTGLTIALWARITPTAGGTDYVLVGKPWNAMSMVSPFYQYGVEFSNSSNRTVDFFFGGPNATLHGPHRLAAPFDVWTHLAFTYDGTTVKGYVDGVERLSATDAASITPRGHSLRLGVDGLYQQFFRGTLDDLRIYSRALTPSEILSAMQTPVGGAPSGVPAADASPAHTVLFPARPNPFRDRTTIGFVLPSPLRAELRLLDVAGRVVRTVDLGPLAAGPHAFDWDGTDDEGRPVASGLYFLRLRAGAVERTTTLLRLR